MKTVKPCFMIQAGTIKISQPNHLRSPRVVNEFNQGVADGAYMSRNWRAKTIVSAAARRAETELSE
jgi:hypothetical protein